MPPLSIAAAVVSLCVLVIALARVMAALRCARAEKAYPPTGHLIRAGAQIVHVEEHGQPQGSAPDLVLIHGSNGNTRDMTFRLMPALADRYRILIFDRPGLGYSSRLPNGNDGINHQAEVLQTVAEQLGADRPIVLGQSYGAGVALSWAVHHPEHLSALVSVSGVSHPWDGSLPTLYRLSSNRVGQAMIVPFISAFVPLAYAKASLSGVFAPQLVPEGYAEHFGLALSLRIRSFAANARQRRALLAEIAELSRHYSSIQTPIEIVHGASDTTVGVDVHARRLIADVAGAHLEVLPGVGHMPHQTHTEAVVDAIDRAAARALVPATLT